MGWTVGEYCMKIAQSSFWGEKRGKTHEVKGHLFHSVQEIDGNLIWKFRDFEFTIRFFPQNCHKKCYVHNRGNKTASKNSDNNLMTAINEIM